MSQSFTVLVRYRPDHTDKFRFFDSSGNDLTDIVVSETNSTIIFQKKPDSDAFTFASFSAVPASDQFSYTLQNDQDPPQMTVTDTDVSSGSFFMNVCVYPNGNSAGDPVCSHPSQLSRKRAESDPEPEIRNQGANR